MVNDFSIQVATVNGSGSQSSNSVLLRSIFQMGIPVSGKISSLPTSQAFQHGSPFALTRMAGLRARRKSISDRHECRYRARRCDGAGAGRVVVYEETLRLNQLRKDLTFFPVPFAKIATGITTDARLRKLLANMIYVGVVGELMEIDPAELDAALAKQFKGKAKAIALNQQALVAGRKFAQENLDRQLVPIRCRRMNETAGKIIIDGNSAAALGACLRESRRDLVSDYSILQSGGNSRRLYAGLSRGTDGKSTFAIVQAEDELAALEWQ
jgi:2-oxoglutarate ferredoxin oxidoreductase subunit alpha